MAKPKLMVYADAGNNTGFGRVQRGILSNLTDKYNIVLFGIGFHGQEDSRNYPYRVYPASTNDQDLLGTSTYFDTIKRVKPDLIWLFQDLWNISKYQVLTPINIPVAVYYPVDTPNMKWQYSLATGAASSVATYTKFGSMETAAGVQDAWNLLYETADAHGTNKQEDRTWMRIAHPLGGQLNVRLDRLHRYQDPANYHIIPHGLDVSQFERRDKTEARKKFGVPVNSFVVLNVGTNQHRKRFDLTFRAFQRLIASGADASLVIHTAGPQVLGYDLAQMARYFGVHERTYLIHEQYSSEQDGMSEDDLVWLYNTADVQINTGGGEGWGLPSFEGAACGVGQLVPNWSATRELWAGIGGLLKVRGYRMETRGLNTAHAEVCEIDTYEQLRHLYDNPDAVTKLGADCYALAQQQPNWPTVANMADKLFQAALNEPEVKPVTLEQAVTQRTRIKSELAP